MKHGTSGYFVKADVSKYFPSIDHAILKEKLKRVVDYERILRLLYTVIDSYNRDIGYGKSNQSVLCTAVS